MNVPKAQRRVVALIRRSLSDDCDPVTGSDAGEPEFRVPTLPSDHGLPMPDATTNRPDERPTEGFHTAFLPARPGRPVRLFLPADYQPKYAYPLVVVFHPDGSDEGAAARLAPALSRRNYITACPRGPVALGTGPSGRPRFRWDESDPRATEYLAAIVAHTCSLYHVHPDRLHLLGVGEGATVAYQLALTATHPVGGVIALNGRLPGAGPCSSAARGLRVFIGHGTNNPVLPITVARQDHRRLRRAGANVRFATYPTTHQVHDDMLRDVNRWIMEAVTDTDGPTLGSG